MRKNTVHEDMALAARIAYGSIKAKGRVSLAAAMKIRRLFAKHCSNVPSLRHLMMVGMILTYFYNLHKD